MASDTKTFLLVGNGPYANRGCEAIVRGTVEILTRRFPGARFVLSSFGDTAHDDARTEIDGRIQHRPHTQEALRRFGAEWLKYRVIRRASTDWRHVMFRVQYEALRRSDCALQIGGDNYTLDYGRPMRHVYLDEVLLSTGKPLVLWGASVGPFSADSAYERQMRHHLARFSLILARESETVEYLSSIGIEANVRLVADPAFAMAPVEAELDARTRRFVTGETIGVNVSPLAGEYRNGTASEWIALVSDCVRTLANTAKCPILLIPHVTCSNNDDSAFLCEVLARLDSKRDLVALAPPTLSAAGYKWLISRLRAFVGARTHASIAALSTATPTISLGYSMKARGINKDIFGSLDWLLPVADLSPGALAERVQALLCAEADVRAYLKATIPQMVSRAYEAAEHIERLTTAGRPKARAVRVASLAGGC